MKPFWDRKEIFLGLSLGLIFSAAWLLQIPWLLLFSLIPIIRHSEGKVNQGVCGRKEEEKRWEKK